MVVLENTVFLANSSHTTAVTVALCPHKKCLVNTYFEATDILREIILYVFSWIAYAVVLKTMNNSTEYRLWKLLYPSSLIDYWHLTTASKFLRMGYNDQNANV